MPGAQRGKDFHDLGMILEASMGGHENINMAGGGLKAEEFVDEWVKEREGFGECGRTGGRSMKVDTCAWDSEVTGFMTQGQARGVRWTTTLESLHKVLGFIREAIVTEGF